MAFRIAAKDFKLFLTDRAAILLTFLVPIVMILVFGFAFGSMSGSSLPKVRVPLVDLDKSAQSRKLVDALSDTGSTTPLAKTSDGAAFSAASARQAVRDGDRYAAVVVPKGFGRRLEAGLPPKLELYYDPSQEVAASMVTGALQQAAGRGLGAEITRARTTKGIKDMNLPPLQEQIALQIASSSLGSGSMRDGATMLVDIEAKTESAKQKEEWPAKAQAVAGPTIMFLLFSVAYGGRSILEERESGTLRRLLISPAPKRNILFGKGIYLLARGVFQVCLMFAIGRLVFGLRVEQHLGPLLLVIFLTAAACTSFGLLLASACTSSRQVDGLATLIVLAMSALGGSMFPRFLMPDWMQTAGLFTINSWAMDAFWGIFWRDFGFAQIALDSAVLLGVTVVMTAISIRLFNTRVTKGI
jgi:ABC-2 type transport system permease protein